MCFRLGGPGLGRIVLLKGLKRKSEVKHKMWLQTRERLLGVTVVVMIGRKMENIWHMVGSHQMSYWCNSSN